MKSATLLLLATATSLIAQGPLTPPDAPAATMKSLDQIEARTAIPKSPAVPVAGPHFIISQPGSYYLTGNIEVASGNGINITIGNVTLDLNGFALISKTVSPAAGNAVDIAANLHSIEIKNGRITGGTVRTYTGPKPWQATFAGAGWSNGIYGATAENLQLSHLTAERCGASGIYNAGSGCTMEHIAANGNGGYGIYAMQGSLTNATATSNGTYGIYAAQGSLTNATATSNANGGILASQASVNHAAANNNGFVGISAFQGSVTDAVATGNGSIGIDAEFGSVANCRATSNFKMGIRVDIGVAAHCVASGNSTDTTTVDKEIDVYAGGQRDACVPASE